MVKPFLRILHRAGTRRQKQAHFFRFQKAGVFVNDQQLLRYSRHILLPELDIEGQQALLSSHVLVIGAGGLGSAVLPYLAASGVGRITIADDDTVELSNLPRQVIHADDSIGLHKAESARQRLLQLNPQCDVTLDTRRADASWLNAALGQFDLVVDCSDNVTVRYALNDAALLHKVPWVSGAAVAMDGQITVFDPRQPATPCYRCLYPDLKEQQLNCSESGVLSPLVGVIGSLQALEALKVLAQTGEPLIGRLLTYDARGGSFREWKFAKNNQCPACGEGC